MAGWCDSGEERREGEDEGENSLIDMYKEGIVST